MWWVVAVVALVVCVSTYLTWTAARVDRLHARAAAAYAALDAHLVRRAVAALALADAAQLPNLVYAGRIALDAQPEEREVAENDLTRQLRVVVAADSAAARSAAARSAAGEASPSPLPPSDVIEPLVAASRRVALARQVHNDVVRDALGMRRRLRVRAFRLARRHPVPTYFDIDDPTLNPVLVEAVTPPSPAV